MAFWTRACVRALTLFDSLMVLDTVAVETLARFATSLMFIGVRVRRASASLTAQYHAERTQRNLIVNLLIVAPLLSQHSGPGAGQGHVLNFLPTRRWEKIFQCLFVLYFAARIRQTQV